MHFMVTGATGLVGRSLVPALLEKKYSVTVVGRDISKIRAIFRETVQAITWNKINTLSPDIFDGVINLAGENIADRRWNHKTRTQIKNSRIEATSRIVSWCLRGKKQLHLYNASAIGIYGLQEALHGLPRALSDSEPAPAGKPGCFLQEVGEAWEKATEPAGQAGIPVTLLRFAVVLKKGSGILGKLALPFSLGLGSLLGSGRQAVSWIHIDDLVGAILFLISRPEITGAINLVAPQAVSQAEFAKTLAGAMKRPLFLRMPAWLIKCIFGQMGEELLLGGQHIYPDRLLKLGYTFQFPDLVSACAQLMNH